MTRLTWRARINSNISICIKQWWAAFMAWTHKLPETESFEDWEKRQW